MKKLILTAFIALACAISANAQFGIVAGITSSATNYEDAAADIKNVSQYHAGVTFRLKLLGNLLSVQPSLIYNMKGTKIGDIAGVEDANINYKTGYIELPVQVQVGLGLGDIARVYGFAEPYLGYAITNEVTTESLAGAVVSDKTWDNVKNRMTYGVSLGVGAEVLRHLQVSVKYFWDLGQTYGSLQNESWDHVLSTITGSECNGVSASIAYLF